MAWGIIFFISISAGIYFGIATVMIMSGKARKAHEPRNTLAFQELFVPYPDIPPLNTFTARDGRELSYRHYPGPSNKILILLHGSGWHSQYLMPLARFISDKGLAQVYTPDLRGHGLYPERRGDVDYIGQL